MIAMGGDGPSTAGAVLPPVPAGIAVSAASGLRLLLACILASALTLVLTVSPAFAARSFESQISEANGSAFVNPQGLAVDGADHLWVTDTGTSLLSEFDSSAAYLAQNDGTGSWSGSPYVLGLAYGRSANLLYAADSNHDDIWGVNAADATYANIEIDSGLGSCCFISDAVDNSGTATDGDIYVATGGLSILRFDPSGNPANFTAGSATGTNRLEGGDTPSGSFNARNVGVDSDGNFYVVDPYHALVDEFAPSGAFIRDFEGTGVPGGLSGAGGFTGLAGVAIDPTNDNVLIVDHGNDVVDEFDSSGVYLDQLVGTGPSEATPFGNLNGGIAVDSAGRVYVSDGGNGVVDVFGPNAILPKLTYGPVTNTTHTSGTLNASVELNGGPDITSCEFQYGTSTAYDSSKPCTPSPPFSSNAPVSAELTGLTPDTTYHYRLVLVTANGVRHGSDQTFTPHAVTELSTDPATNISASSARLNASFSGESEDVHYYFEWSTDSSFANKTVTPPGVLVPAPIGSQSVSFDLGRLQPDTEYRYRIVASDSFGITVGSTQTFTTVGRYQFSSDIGSTGSGDGQLKDPQDVAVDNSTGDLYVADTGNNRVVKFDSSGDFIAAWGWGVGGGVSFEVCASGCHAGISGTGSGQFESPTFIEVDNSEGPSKGDVYVADAARGVIQKFDASGGLIASWGSGGAIDLSKDAPTEGITIDDDGNLFASAGEPIFASTEAHWTEFGQDGTYRRQISTAGSFEGLPNDHALGRADGHGIDINAFGSFYQASEGGVDIASPVEAHIERSSGEPENAPTGLVVERSSGDLYVDHGSFIYRFPASIGCYPHSSNASPLCSHIETFGRGELTGALGLAINPATGSLYAANAGADDIAAFSPLPLSEVTTGPPKNPGSTSVTITGRLAPAAAGPISDCHFEYGTDTTYNLGEIPCSPSAPISAPTEVSADLGDLTPFTTYHYRLVVTGSDSDGYPSFGHDQTFTPSPGLSPTIDATSSPQVTPTTVVMSAQINPNLAPTIYRFQYGTDSSYGSQSPPSESIGEDGVDHGVSTEIDELTPGTTYHFRAIAVNFSGLSQGTDQTFNTPDLPSIAGSEATSVSQRTATLSAQIKPGFRATNYHFEYGPSSAYGSSSPTGALAGSDDTLHSASAAIESLQAGTTYHYRVVATNAIGTAEGPDQVFTTASPALLPVASAGCKKGFVEKKGTCVKARQRHKSRSRKGRHQKRSVNHG